MNHTPSLRTLTRASTTALRHGTAWGASLGRSLQHYFSGNTGSTHPFSAYAFLRSTSLATLVAFVGLTMQPLVAAAQTPTPAPLRAKAASLPAELGYLAEVEAAVKGVVPEAWHPVAGVKAKAIPPLLAQVSDASRLDAARLVLTRAKAIDSTTEQILNELAQTRRQLLAQDAAPEILARHDQVVAEMKARQQEFQRLVANLDTSLYGAGGTLSRVMTKTLSQLGYADVSDPVALQSTLSALGGFLAAHPNRRAHTPSDPDHLPWGSPQGKPRAPMESELAYRRSSLFPHQTIKVAANGNLSGIALPTSESGPPTASDLGESDDVTLTAAIKSQAQALGNHPVKIHEWVRNNVEFIPSYGSIQGADFTLQSKRGNAFDTASLEIALLRAAGIPARYVYGTIQLPVAQVQNWVGGVSTPGAAQDLLGQGGIPNVGMISGGQISAIRLEHVWVEAWVGYAPSRGGKNGSQGDTWVPLDASFKQYQYTQGMNLAQQVPMDAQALVNQAQQGATVNNTEGWVQNLNQAAMQNALSTYQSNLQAYVNQTKANATVGDVLGTKTIQATHLPYLAGTLPYRTIATGSRFATLPSTLQWQYRTSLSDQYGVTDLVSISQPTTRLAGKKLTISFSPATQADTNLINSYLPKPHTDGTPIQPSELPTSLPGYLLHLTPEIRVDGKVVNQGGTVSMGDTLTQNTAFFNPGTQQWEEGEPNAPIAGDYHAIGLDLQGVSQAQMSGLQTKLQKTLSSLQQYQANPSNVTLVNGLTKEDLVGDLLYANILSFFANVDGNDQVTAWTRGDVVNYRAPSYGAFFAGAQPHYWFGVVKSVSFPGVTMDVDRVVNQVIGKDGDATRKLSYARQVGTAGSNFEASVPETLFVDRSTCNAPNATQPDPAKPTCAQGMSAVRALAAAAAQGQKIYTLNKDNQSYHSKIIAGLNTDAEVKAEIANALAAGKEVTVHQGDVTVSGWTGIGYTIIDPDTGAGAYKISGGASGGMFIGFINGFGLAAILAGFAIGASTVLMLVLGVLLVTSVIASLIALASVDQDGNCYAQGVSLGFSVYGIITSYLDWKGVLGGSGKAQTAIKLLINILVAPIMSATVPSNTAWQCI